jgi:peptide/nickel transport system substrate-binding protein
MSESYEKKSSVAYPSKAQWMQLLNVLSKKEKILFSAFLFLAISSFSFLSAVLFLNNTKAQPTVGGYYSEAITGSPRFINPIYAQANDVDRDLVEIIFSGLMTYDSNGKLIPQLAKEYSISEDGKIYQFVLKDNLFWHDKKPLTVDDVIFTIKTIQNPDFKSPLRVSWSGIEIERASDNTIRFILQKQSSIFLEYCTFKIIPEHVWKSITPENFPLSPNNLKPIGSGPYKFETLEQDQNNKIISLTLARNENYFAKGPYISKITFYFFDSQDDLIKNYATKDIKGLALASPEELPKINLGLQAHSLTLPRYFALFFNLNPSNGDSKTLADNNLRKALNYATDKEEIIQKVLLGYGQLVDSPVMPHVYDIEDPKEVYSFDLQKAQEILENSGFKETSDG